ncbi:glycosyltransferase [Sinimarinibacterium thermocellulolyticum]|uniref:Glycosyltransferase n=1 Tax=Sinimarinibacterium thermocellulolyticum TaxID=3170016 RepID=A0ABV2A9F5_9GAMM
MSGDRALVIVTTSFPLTGDGSEAAGSFVSDLAEELSRHVPVRVVAPGKSDAREMWGDGVDVFRYAAPAQPLSTLKLGKPADLLAIAGVMAAGLRATRTAVRAGPTAHILALWALPSGHWARRIALETGLPYSVWTLGSDIWTLGRIPVVRGYLRRVLHAAQRCYSDGLALAEDTRRIAGREVEFLPSTRRIERTRTAPLKSAPPYRLLFLGRWHPNKGVDLLIDALKLLSREDWQRIEGVEICGGGPLEGLVKQGVAELRAAGRPVELRGYLNKAAAEEAILRADYLIIPSRIESIPVVFSDAVKLGCPVVASPVGDLPALLQKEPTGGVLAKEASAVEIKAAIGVACSEGAPRFAAGVRQLAHAFSITAIVDRLLVLRSSAK